MKLARRLMLTMVLMPILMLTPLATLSPVADAAAPGSRAVPAMIRADRSSPPPAIPLGPWDDPPLFRLWAPTTWPESPAPPVEKPWPAGRHPDMTIVVYPLQNKLTLFIDGLPQKTYRIALGKPETPTPVGEFLVINKYKNWGSGFGTRWIGLNVPWGIYGIHGTNRPHSIGTDASHGCIRMHNRDVEELYEKVGIGTKVIILGHVLGEPHQNPRSLAKGDVGGDVLLIQNRLRGAGFFQGECNGRFGSRTEAAMKAFERANDLPVDGVVNLHDYEALGLLE